eukprot:8582445-Prorocentrum_lima.AAC.1
MLHCGEGAHNSWAHCIRMGIAGSRCPSGGGPVGLPCLPSVIGCPLTLAGTVLEDRPVSRSCQAQAAV